MLSARVHPGETNASFMMKGAIDFLLGETKEAMTLRKHFVFRIVPMLNPDGVIYGNYRCSLLGVDLNRRWQSPSKYLHPTVFYTKRFMQYFSEEHEIALYCDMHGHSMKKNMFMYANCLKPTDMQGRNTNVLIKMVPRLLSKTNKLFSFKESHFRIEPSKLSTARVVVFKELNIPNSYTLEASFYGPRTQAQLVNLDPPNDECEDPDSQMTTGHMESLGRDLCRVMLAFTSQRAFRLKLNEVTNALREELLQPVVVQGGKLVVTARSESIEDSKPEDNPTDPLCNMFPTLDSNREGLEDEEEFWAKVTAFEEKAYKVLYEQTVVPALANIPKKDEADMEEEEEQEMLDVQTAIQTIAEVKEMPEELGNEGSQSDDGGSDSLGSDNDDNKQEFMYRKTHAKKTKRKTKKTTGMMQKRDPKAHSCLRHGHIDPCSISHPLCRPKTPFVFGNYPDQKQKVVPRIARFLKVLQVETPKPYKVSTAPQQGELVQVLPTQMLLAGYRAIEEAPKVKIVTGVGGLKTTAAPPRVSFCPSTSTSALSISKSPDLSLRIRTSRAVEPLNLRPKMGSKLALRNFNISPV